MKNAVIIHTVRGGRDPDDYHHLVTLELWEKLTPHDPWIELGEFEDNGDPGVLVAYKSDDECRRWATQNDYVITDVVGAIGY